MKRALSRAFEPPAPMVPVRVRAPGGIDVATVDGKLDTGADICALPETALAQLDVSPVRVGRAAGFAGALIETHVYRVDVELDEFVVERVEALATRRPYAIIGRNVLRHFVLRIDGPKGMLELTRGGRLSRGASNK
jgi:predicted aspartyl protease